MKKREARRDLTYRVSVQAWRRRVRILLHWERTAPEWSKTMVTPLLRAYKTPPWRHAPHWFAERGWNECNCRGRRRGNPKIGVGMCKSNGSDYRHTVVDRRRGRKSCTTWRAWVLSGWDLLDCTE